VVTVFHRCQVTDTDFTSQINGLRKFWVESIPACRVITKLLAEFLKTSFEFSFVAADSEPIVAAHVLQQFLRFAIATSEMLCTITRHTRLDCLQGRFLGTTGLGGEDEYLLVCRCHQLGGTDAGSICHRGGIEASPLPTASPPKAKSKRQVVSRRASAVEGGLSTSIGYWKFPECAAALTAEAAVSTATPIVEGTSDLKAMSKDIG
jgi:hypothetical protein